MPVSVNVFIQLKFDGIVVVKGLDQGRIHLALLLLDVFKVHDGAVVDKRHFLGWQLMSMLYRLNVLGVCYQAQEKF